MVRIKSSFYLESTKSLIQALNMYADVAYTDMIVYALEDDTMMIKGDNLTLKIFPMEEFHYSVYMKTSNGFLLEAAVFSVDSKLGFEINKIYLSV